MHETTTQTNLQTLPERYRGKVIQARTHCLSDMETNAQHKPPIRTWSGAFFGLAARVARYVDDSPTSLGSEIYAGRTVKKERFEGSHMQTRISNNLLLLTNVFRIFRGG